MSYFSSAKCHGDVNGASLVININAVGTLH